MDTEATQVKRRFDMKHMSIRARLIVLLVAFALPFAGLFAWYVARESRESSDEAYSRVKLIADNVAANIGLTLHDDAAMLARLAELPAVRAMNASSCGPFTGEFGAALSEYAEIGLRDVLGNSVCAFVPNPPSAEQTVNFPWFKEGIRTKGLAVGDAFQGSRQGRWFSVLTHPVFDKSDKLAGLVVFRLDLLKLNQRTMATVPQLATVAVLGRDFRFLMRSSDPERWIGKALPAELATSYRGRRQGFERLPDIQGVPRLWAFVTVPGTGWYVAAGLPAAEVFADSQTLIVRGIAVGLVALLLLSALVWRLGASILGPIASLVETTKKIGGGDFKARARVDGPSEIAEVAQRFNDMLDTRLRLGTQLQESDIRFRSIVDSAMDAIVSTDSTLRIVQFNPAAELMFRLTAGQAIGRPVDELIPPSLRARHGQQMRAFGAGNSASRAMGERGILHALRADGAEFPIEASISKMASGDGVFYTVIMRDVSARLLTEKRVRRQEDFFATLSQTNKAIVRLHDPQTLYQKICDICVDYGHARLAYIGLVSGDHVKPVAKAGAASEFLSAAEILIDPALPQGRGPIALAIKEGRAYVCNDFETDPNATWWRERAQAMGTQATAAFPFRRSGVVIGALSLHVQEKNFFDASLIALLEEMTGDISFALDNYDREAALLVNEERYRRLVDFSPDAILIHQDRRIVFVNRAMVHLMRADSEAQLIGRPSTFMLPPEFHESALYRTANVYAGLPQPHAEQIYLRLDGTSVPVEIASAPVVFDGKPSAQAIVRDISERREAEARERRLINFYSALSQTNQALVRIREPHAIYQEICNICVKFGHARIAWIGLTNGGRVEPACFAGPAEQFVSGLVMPLDAGLPDGVGPVAIAVREGRSYVCNDYLGDPNTLPWRGRAQYLGTLAVSAFPFRRSGVVIGALSLHVPEKDFFSPQLIELLEEMAVDLSFALDNFDRETGRRAAELALREAEERYRGLVDMSPEAIYVLQDRKFIFANPAALLLFGARDASDLLQRSIFDFLHADFHALVHSRLLALEQGASASPGAEQVFLRLDGVPVDVDVISVHIDYDGASAVQVIARDITERKRNEARISYLATHDELTDLPNRALIHDRITQAISHARRAGRQLALMYLDLDRFKVINDGYGRMFGDAVLKSAGQKLRLAVRDGDTVARLSGDEFLVLLADLRQSSDAYIVTQKVLDALGQAIVIDGREVVASASIGVSVFPQNGEDADTLIVNADIAMYRAKELGRSTYQFFTEEMSEDTQRRVELETQLRTALPLHQLSLVYQPKVSLSTGAVIGCEALLRWQHPTLGAVSPARFIPIAEESGMIVPIGDWVLRHACLQNKAWLDAGLPPVVMSVNLSARQFLQQNIVHWVLRTLRETGLSAQLLELELTESLIAQDTENVISTVLQLKQAGVRFSIDDFGTGYSSLSYLKRFQVETLKIDQSFIRNMLNDPDDSVIPLAIIALAHRLRLRVIAEGVETSEHCEFLRQNGCDEIQGYFFSKPLSAQAFEDLLRSGRRLEAA